MNAETQVTDPKDFTNQQRYRYLHRRMVRLFERERASYADVLTLMTGMLVDVSVRSGTPQEMVEETVKNTFEYVRANLPKPQTSEVAETEDGAKVQSQ
jgi:hypothetical protein